MAILGNNDVFSGSQLGFRQLTVVANGGTATLQALAISPDGTKSWVDVPDGAYSADTNETFYAPADQKYRFVLTGNAVVNVS